MSTYRLTRRGEKIRDFTYALGAAFAVISLVFSAVIVTAAVLGIK